MRIEKELNGYNISWIIGEIVVCLFSIDSIRSGKLKIAKRRTSNGMLFF